MDVHSRLWNDACKPNASFSVHKSVADAHHLDPFAARVSEAATLSLTQIGKDSNCEMKLRVDRANCDLNTMATIKAV